MSSKPFAGLWKKGQIRSNCPTWKIEDFPFLSSKVGYAISSPTFFRRVLGTHNASWYFKLYPNGDSERYRGFVSIYLYLNSCSIDGVEVNFELSVIDEDNVKNESRRAKRFLYLEDSKGHNTWGFPDFVNREKLLDPSNRLLGDGSLTIHSRLWGFSDCKQNVHETVQSASKDNLFRESLWAQYLNQKFTDVTFIVGLKNFRLHKTVLAANSSVFATMFDTKMKEAKQNIVTISDCDPDTFEEFIIFLYLAKVNNLLRFQSGLFVLADKYAVDALKTICERSILSTLSVNNAIKILLLADLHSATRMKMDALEFIKGHAFEVTTSMDWGLLACNPELLREVMSIITEDM